MVDLLILSSFPDQKCLNFGKSKLLPCKLMLLQQKSLEYVTLYVPQISFGPYSDFLSIH